MLSPPVSDRRVAVGRLAILITVIAWAAYFGTWLFSDLFNARRSSAVDRAESIVYLLVVTLLTISSLAYLLTRLGFFYRAGHHRRASRRELEELFDQATPTLTVLVPSYQEETRVIRATLLSAALQEYPDIRITLLIDDPPQPGGRRARELLEGARSLPGELAGLLAPAATRFSRALEEFEDAAGRHEPLDEGSMATLASHYQAASDWLSSFAEHYERGDHADAFLVDEVLLRLAGELWTVAEAVREAARQEAVLPPDRVRQLYRRLAWTFRAELSSFERKRYGSLSAEPNKASNLNSYLGLMGGHYRAVATTSGMALVACGPADAQLRVPDPDYVLTLDADSMVLPEYCLRLVHLLEQTEHRDVAIAQTPYSAFPGAATRLERIAGATTDLQHLVHQGLTYYNATFWVGANAVIRKRALDDIATTTYRGDWELREYIKDRTVIEDTESTVDLGIKGWRLFNYPERLSYSATPPDFGSLAIQRRRWANGGLIILPKLRHQRRARRRAGERVRFGELFLRWNYMASISWSSVSLLVLLTFPFSATLINPLLGAIALPYFLAQASDLRYCGYKRLDVVRIYGFNLVLVPINLAGTLASLTQILTASKSAFARTPKVRDRTVTPAFFLAAPYGLAGLAAYTAWVAYEHSLDENLAYGALNVVMALYAIVAFIGIRHSLADAWLHATSLLYKRERPELRPRRQIAPAPSPPAPPDWQAILQVGPAYARRWANASGVAMVGRGDGRWQLTGNLAPGRGDGTVSIDQTAALVTGPPKPLAVHLSKDGTPVAFRTVFQPFVELASGRTVGFEAFSRFDDGVSAERWLAKARRVGAETAFEGALARATLEAIPHLPPRGLVAVKTSRSLLRADPVLLDRLRALGRIVIAEMSLPAPDEVDDVLDLARALPGNVHLAVEHVELDDDSKSSVSRLRPALVKLQLEAIFAIYADRARQAKVQAMVRLLAEFGGSLMAVGIESESDRGVLRRLGVRFGQGFLLGRPQELVDA